MQVGKFLMKHFILTQKLIKNHKQQEAILAIKNKFGKNAILKGMNFEDGATTRERNQQIGGHKSGNSETF